jgi:hypothetical protein
MVGTHRSIHVARVTCLSSRQVPGHLVDGLALDTCEPAGRVTALDGMGWMFGNRALSGTPQDLHAVGLSPGVGDA